MLWIILIAVVVVGGVVGVTQYRHRQTMRMLRSFAAPRALEAREHAPVLKSMISTYALLGSVDYDLGHLLVSGFTKSRGGQVAYPFPVADSDQEILDRVVYFRVTATSARTPGGAEAALAAALLRLPGHKEGEYGALYYPLPASFPAAMFRPRESTGLPALTAKAETHWEEFNHRVEIRTPDERFVSALLSPRTLEFWNDRLAGIQVNFVPGGMLLINGRWDVADYDHFVGLAEQLESRIPRHLIEEYS